MEIAIIGGGIAGLSFALHLHKRGLKARVFESVPEIREIGVGITLLPHAMREFTAIGVDKAVAAAGIENLESCFFNRFGQLIYKEPRGRHGGNAYPEIGLHRGRLHRVLLDAVGDRLGPDAVVTAHHCDGVTQDADGVEIAFADPRTGTRLGTRRADLAIACDGIDSAIRRQFYPDEALAFAGINTWRGVTRRAPILTGRSYMRVGSIKTGKLVIYPIIDDRARDGTQVINWMAEIEGDRHTRNDWNKPGRLDDFFHLYEDWHFDWLDVADMIRNAETILEYPMVDRDPVARWVFGRVALMGDAAHPMYPRGSNGAAQAAIDARTLAACLAAGGDAQAALKAYEDARLPATTKVVLANRANPPDIINIRVEELVGDRPFDNLDDFITQEELRALSDRYKEIAGFSANALQAERGEGS
ncbi:MAG: flavin-dependent oxidoreductase [Alphaproteobacteria bacterium]|nr:flavin-dependent oxidoreductase [Alphaproteobacteria bacterium]